MSLLQRLRNRFFLELDLASWRGSLGGAVPAAGRGKTVLLCDLMSGVATRKAQALYARALAAHGFAPVVLMPGRDRLAERLYNAAQPTRFIRLDEQVDETMRAVAADRARQMLAEDPDFTGLLTTEIDGVRIGRNVLSLVLRRLRTGRLDPANSEHRRLAEEILTQSLIAKGAAERVLDSVRPDLALFNERGYTPAGEVFDLCIARGIDAVQWLGAPQADRLLFKRYRPANRADHPLALDDATWERAKASPWDGEAEGSLMAQLASNYVSGAWFNRQQLQSGKLHKPAEDVRAQLGIAPGRKLAAIFCHILYDATFFYGDSLFADYEEWLVETVRAAIANPSLDWIVKVHPVNVWRSRMDGEPMEQLEVQALRRAFGELPPHVRVMPADTDVNSWSLFHAVDYGLTVRGTVGMELPCIGVPMVTAGTGRYAGRGFTMDPANPEEYRALLARLHEIPRLDESTVSLARRYAHATFFRRPVPIRSFVLDFHADTYGLPALGANTLVREKPESAEDLRSLAAWMAEGVAGRADYLTAEP
ncbi:MAG: hypothetical protein HY055_00785 [Magnetospirillum sp.]|nr:hypothetical protein [Magnetospirillum sp.]